MSDLTDQYISSHSKSQIVGFILALLFGPIGLFYSNWVMALVLTGIAVAAFSTIIAPVACWGLSLLLTFYLVSRYNRKVIATAMLHQSSARD